MNDLFRHVPHTTLLCACSLRVSLFVRGQPFEFHSEFAREAQLLCRRSSPMSNPANPALSDDLTGPEQSTVNRRLQTSALQRSLCCLLISWTLCGCASGLMSLPGAAMMADRFSGTAGKDKDNDADNDKESRKTSSEKKDKRDKKRGKDEDNDFGSRIDTPLLSEYMSVQGNTMIVLRGVGLVTGLNGTGGDPSPSALRTQLQNEMSRRNVKNAKQILASRDTAMVVVTAYLPAMVRKDQRFDVRVALPPNSNAKSLKGGWLLETRLFEEQNIEGRGTLKGNEYAVAGGAILTSLGVKENRDERRAELMSGTIPGGAISRTDRDLSIVLRSEKRGSRNSERVANAVSTRFHKYNRYGQKIACAEAKTDALVELKTHERYVNNFPRYQAVIRNIALNESDVARRIRMEMLARDILEPDKCQAAALQLEAIGEDTIPFLKDALESESFEVRFQAAQSLAYLGNASGVSVLAEAVRNQPAFRIYGLVALSVIDDADAVLALRQLMNEETLETRYGAFRSLKELDVRDPSLHQMAFENRFVMYVIDSTGEPMVHVTRRRAPEIVVFGSQQSLRLPAVLNAGRNIRVKGEAGAHEVEITCYQLDMEPQKQKIPNRIIDIVRVCGQLGATYPDIVQMLIEAEQQHNFVGQFGIDRLPQAGRLYLKRDGIAEIDEDGKRIGNPKMIPELFDELDEDELKENESDAKLMALDFEAVAKQDQKDDAKGGKTTQRKGNKAASDSSRDVNTPEGSPRNSELPDSESVSDEESSDLSDPLSSDVAGNITLNESSDDETDNSGSEIPKQDRSKKADTGSSSRTNSGKRWFEKLRSPFGGLQEPEL